MGEPIEQLEDFLFDAGHCVRSNFLTDSQNVVLGKVIVSKLGKPFAVLMLHGSCHIVPDCRNVEQNLPIFHAQLADSLVVAFSQRNYRVFRTAFGGTEKFFNALVFLVNSAQPFGGDIVPFNGSRNRVVADQIFLCSVADIAVIGRLKFKTNLAFGRFFRDVDRNERHLNFGRTFAVHKSILVIPDIGLQVGERIDKVNLFTGMRMPDAFGRQNTADSAAVLHDGNGFFQMSNSVRERRVHDDGLIPLMRFIG